MTDNSPLGAKRQHDKHRKIPQAQTPLECSRHYGLRRAL